MIFIIQTHPLQNENNFDKMRIYSLIKFQYPIDWSNNMAEPEAGWGRNPNLAVPHHFISFHGIIVKENVNLNVKENVYVRRG